MDTRGVLVSQNIRTLIERGNISSVVRIEDTQIQNSSLDMTLSDQYFELDAAFLPRPGEKVRDLMRELGAKSGNLSSGVIFERRKVYVVPLNERLSLPPGLLAEANPKSSTGRTDTFVRLLANGHQNFDKVPRLYEGELYAMIVPHSFNIRVSPGISLNQLKIIKGSPKIIDRDLSNIMYRNHLLYGPNNIPLSYDDIILNNGIVMRVLLEEGGVYYKAKETNKVLDMTRNGANRMADFWDKRIIVDGSIVLEPDEFYLLGTYERLKLSPDLVAKVEAIDVDIGEFRGHYAGWVDAGRGYGEQGDGKGLDLTMEVRHFGTPFVMRNKQLLSRLVFEMVLQTPDRLYGVGSHYATSNGVTPGKYFSD